MRSSLLVVAVASVAFLLPVTSHASFFHRSPRERLHIAASGGHLDKVKELLRQGVDPNDHSPTGDPALTFAARGGHVDVIDFLIKAGAKVNFADTRGVTALSTAVTFNKLDAVKDLITHGANLNAPQSDGTTPLMKAAESGYGEIVKTLLDAGAWTTPRNENGMTAQGLAKGREIANLIKAKGPVGPKGGGPRAPSAPAGAVHGSHGIALRSPVEGAKLTMVRACPPPNSVMGPLFADTSSVLAELDLTSPQPLMDLDTTKRMVLDSMNTVKTACGGKNSLPFTTVIRILCPGYAETADPAVIARFQPRSLMHQNAEFNLVDRVYAEAKRKAFYRRNKVDADVTPSEFVGNPFLYSGKTAAFVATFVTMESSTLGRFSFPGGGQMFVQGLPAGMFTTPGQQALIAGNVAGKSSAPGGGGRLSTMNFKDAYTCTEPGCNELNANTRVNW